MSCRALLSLSRALSASVIGAAGGPEDACRVDPAAALREATERNAREAQQERDAAAQAEAEAADEARAEADAAAKAQADATAKEQADAAAKVREEEASRDRAPEATDPQQTEPPVEEGQALTRGAGADQTALERGGADPVILEAEVPSRALTTSERGSWPEVPEVPPSSAELVVGRVVTTRVPARQRPARAVSTLRPMEVGVASSSVPDTKATSTAPPDWASGAGSGVLNMAVKGILEQFNAHGATLLKSRSELLAMQTAVQDYHNLRAAAYNSQNQALAKRTANLNQSREAAANLKRHGRASKKEKSVVFFSFSERHIFTSRGGT
nr:general transcriptional corepressor CYC8-like [Aegilops tauschii subsp. strangulata]